VYKWWWEWIIFSQAPPEHFREYTGTSAKLRLVGLKRPGAGQINKHSMRVEAQFMPAYTQVHYLRSNYFFLFIKYNGTK
jgi:hypothetical protein